MAAPFKYVVGYSFAGFQSTTPQKPLPGTRVDVEYANIATAITSTQDALADIRRDDGQLVNGIVTPESLDPGMALGVLPPEPWSTGVQYAPPQSVWNGNKLYQCILKHVSTVFADDLASGCWNLVVDFDPPIDEAEAAAIAAQNSADVAAANATTAMQGAATATTKAQEAANSNTSAFNYATSANASKNAAAASATAAAASATAADADADRAEAAAAAMLPDAASDGKTYGRRNAAWSEALPVSAYTAADVLAKLLTVDGIGSGLDADLFDGQNSSFFAPVNNPQFTGVPLAPNPPTNNDSPTVATTAYVQANVRLLAPKDSPALVGTPTAPVAPPGTNTAQIATTSFVAAGFVTTGQATANYAPLASPVFTGNPTAPTVPPGNNSTSIATTAFVAASFAPIASPVFTGNPTAPTPSAADNDTSIATTAFVKNAVAATGVVATADTRNKIVNSAFQISQENGFAVNIPNASYIADQWQWSYATAGTPIATLNNADPTTNYIRISSAGVVDAAVAAGDVVSLYTRLEGHNTRDLQWGTPAPKAAVLRFSARLTNGPATLVMSCSVRTASGTHSFVHHVTLNSNAGWQDFVVPIPGPTVGVWATDIVGAQLVSFNLMGGSTYLAPSLDTWNAGNFTVGPGMGNVMAVANSLVDFKNIGFYADPLNTGLAPPFEVPDYATELSKCQRYWQQTRIAYYGNIVTGLAYGTYGYLPVTPRFDGAPVSGTNSVNTAFPATVGGLSLSGNTVFESRTSNATTTFGRWITVDVTVNARM